MARNWRRWMTGSVIVGFSGFALTVVMPALAADTVTANRLPNAAFEMGKDGTPDAWKTQAWGGQARFAWGDGGRSGQALEVASESGADAGWYCMIPVEPYSKYRLSAWVKTIGVEKGTGRGFQLNIHELQRRSITVALTGDHDWTELSTEFETDDLDMVQVNAVLGGWGLSTGTVFVDDVSLVQIEKSKLADMEPLIKIDATKVGEPIDPYVYGQFIEHLGRCIYGGIWAEMLEDRKFYWPIGKNDGAFEDHSPWKTYGDVTVEMVKEDPFVGEHSPQITVHGKTDWRGVASDELVDRGGIMQSRLGVREGTGLHGRIWVKSDTLDRIYVAIDSDQFLSTLPIPVTKEYACQKFHFPLLGSTSDGGVTLRVFADNEGSFTVGAISLMPDDNIYGMRADTLRELKKLDSPVYRWPGGNFVSGYDWKDGIGDPDRRPPRKNPAWTGVESNDMGIDEFLAFCRYLGTEPYIAVNSGLGGVESAVEEVEYCNGAADTPMGKWRTENGSVEPYGVKFWSIGNEMYGDWQLGNMPQEQYIVKHKQFYNAMRGVDPTIELIGVGAVGAWSENMMRECADEMQMVSEHVYWQDRSSVLAHIRQATDSIRNIAAAHRSYRERLDSLKGKDIRICLDEWNYWYGPTPFGELGTRYFLKDGLGCAAALNEMYRNSDLYRMANYAQTVNVIGCIKTNTIHAALETTGLVLVMHRHHFGTLPVATETSPRMDVQAALTADRSKLTISVVNPNSVEVTMPLEIAGVKLIGTGVSYQIAGSDPLAYNDPEAPDHLVIAESALTDVGDSLTVPAYSATVFVLNVLDRVK